jgi:hypothetical protein
VFTVRSARDTVRRVVTPSTETATGPGSAAAGTSTMRVLRAVPTATELDRVPARTVAVVALSAAPKRTSTKQSVPWHCAVGMMRTPTAADAG